MRVQGRGVGVSLANILLLMAHRIILIYESMHLLHGPKRISDGAVHQLHGPKRISDGATQQLHGPKRISDGATQQLHGPKRISDGAMHRCMDQKESPTGPRTAAWTKKNFRRGQTIDFTIK